MTPPLVHLVHQPGIKSSRPRMAVLLHGVGSNEEDLFSLADSFDPGLLVVSVRAPLTLGPGSYSWFPVQFTADGPVADAAQAELSLIVLQDFVTWACNAYGADPQQTVLVGFSQGAIMAAGLALTRPELVHAAVLMSGRILPEFLATAAPLEQLKETSFLIVHGTQDNVLPIAHGRASREMLRKLGLEPDYREFSMGHTISDESLAFVLGWIETHC